jgi:hypothetical protein
VLLAQGDVASHDLLERPHAVPLLTDVQGLAEPPRFQAECPPTLEMIPSTPIRLFADSPIRSFADSPIRSFALSYGHRLLVGYHPRKPQVRREGYTLSPGADAHVLGQWEDGGPAVVASRFGQGWCISTGAFLQYLAPEAGSRLARAVVQWALGGKLPLRVSGLPPAGDVNVLRQEDRLMVHLLNLEAWQIKDPDRPLDADNLERIGKAKPVPKVEVEVALPDGFRPRRAFTISPDFRGERPVKLTVASGTARFSVGPLDLYQVVVIER